jgi:hypothetical protein
VCSHKPPHFSGLKCSLQQKCKHSWPADHQTCHTNIRSEPNTLSHFPFKDSRWNHTQPSWCFVPIPGCQHNWTRFIHCFPNWHNVHTSVVFNWSYVRPLLQRYWHNVHTIVAFNWSHVGPLLQRYWHNVYTSVAFNWSYVRPVLQSYWQNVHTSVVFNWSHVRPLLLRYWHNVHTSVVLNWSYVRPLLQCYWHNVHTRVAFNWSYVRPLMQRYWRGLTSADSALLGEVLLHIFLF